MANTTNFGWETPDDTDLVKDGASAIRTLGSAIDTSLVDLKGGTTGQVLSKASNTDMDFTWVAQDDSNAIQNAIVDAKGDLITATAADTPARLAVGTNGQYLIADSTTATGLKWGDVSAGSLTLLSTTTLTGSGITISSINQGYKNLRLRIKGAYTSTTFRSFFITFNNDSGSNYYGYGDWWTGGSEWTNNAATSFQFYNLLTSSNTTITNVGLEMNIFDYAGNGAKDSAINLISTVDGNKFLSAYSRWASTSAINRVDITTNGTFSGGSVEIWGIN